MFKLYMAVEKQYKYFIAITGDDDISTHGFGHAVFFF